MGVDEKTVIYCDVSWKDNHISINTYSGGKNKQSICEKQWLSYFCDRQLYQSNKNHLTSKSTTQ